MDLRLVSLHKSLPQEWPHQFQQTLNGRARVKFSRRSQLEDILKGLGRSRWGISLCLPCIQQVKEAASQYLAAPPPNCRYQLIDRMQVASLCKQSFTRLDSHRPL